MREITDNEFDNAIDVSGKVLVDFYSTFCPPCKIVAPILEALSQDPTDVTFLKINIDDHPVSPSKHHVTSVPTLVLYNFGYEVKRHVGAISDPALREWLGV